jgi:hypothetical protein
MSWYSNPWVVGVISGIPSGLLVNWVSRKLLGKREDREYLQKTLIANREVIYAIRPGISEGHIPTYEVLTALINATARRYGVEPEDLYTPKTISEELVKEVMDSSFLSSSQKTEYCNRLADLSNVTPPNKTPQSSNESRPTELLLYRSRIIQTTSRYLGFLTSVLAVTFSVAELSRSRISANIPNDLETKIGYLLPAAMAVVIVAVTTLAVYVYRELVRRRETQSAIEVARYRAEIAEQRAKESLHSLQRSLSERMVRSAKARAVGKNSTSS